MAATPTPGNLFDEFEETFQNCMAPLIKEDHFNAVNQDELRTNAETSGQKFLDIARQLEAFFLQKRYLLSIQKPELILMEDILEMRSELSRKDELLKRHADKLGEWQNLLSSMQTRLGTSSAAGRPSGTSTQSSTLSSGMVGGGGSSGSSGGSSGGPSSGATGGGGGGGTGGGGGGGVTGGGGGGGVGSGGGGNVGVGGGSSGGTGMNTSGPPSVGSHVSVPMPGLSPVGGNMCSTSVSSSGPPMSHTMNPGMGMSQSSMMQMGGGGGSMGPGPGMGGIGGMSQGTYQGGPGGAMFPGNMGQQPPGGLQGPLAYLEKTTTNIGVPEPRR
ncbi:uncharacterized transmembrane protein DDB_G0289901-like [Palaemon carinicauda]|uniref:uncharacterized transmembrane protein DDB_G0289901-like n=1 Tax=Palaemon carinicauda TaxID=392227 RepID=UPI0035B6A6C7